MFEIFALNPKEENVIFVSFAPFSIIVFAPLGGFNALLSLLLLFCASLNLGVLNFPLLPFFVPLLSLPVAIIFPVLALCELLGIY